MKAQLKRNSMRDAGFSGRLRGLLNRSLIHTRHVDSERLDRIRKLCTEVSKLAPAERDAFLRQHAADQPELIAEVVRLLNSADSETVLAFKAAPEPASNEHGDQENRAFASGEILANRFRIIRFISSGGMGEVYAAEDLQLGRQVAIKTIRREFALRPGVVERFRREIFVSLRITHPNVCRVFDLEGHRSDSGEILFLTMELLEGETLESWMSRHRAVSTKAAAPIVLQILRGLKAAHQVGIIHRDFKPSNVFLVPEPNGAMRAVVMDFGLALLGDPKKDASAADLVGTPMYMAPEQLEGRGSSIASDIYSVGVVLYELTTGRKPFPAGNSNSHPFTRLRAKPASPWEYLRDINGHSEKVIVQCLSVDPKERPASVDTVMQALRLEASTSQLSGTWKRRRIGIALALVLLSAAIFWLQNGAGERIDNLSPLTSETDLSADPSLSHDGKMIAYESDRGEPGNLDVWIQKLPNGTPRRITTDPAEDDDTNLSSDGTQVVFHSDRNGGGIYIANTNGGPERLLVPFGHRPKFSPDGKTIVFWTGEYDEYIPSAKLYKIPASGGRPERIAPDFVDARYPIWSPDGRGILFTGCRQVVAHAPLSTCQEWWVASADSSRVFNTGALARFRREGIRTRYWPSAWSSKGVFFPAYAGRQSEIWRVGLSQESWRVIGKPVRLTFVALSAVDATIAGDGTIAFGELGGAVHIWKFPLLPAKESKGAFKLTNGPDSDVDPSVSRDGRILVFSRGEKQHRVIWLKDLTSGQESRLASPSLNNIHPVVSLYNNQIAFEGDDTLSKALYTVDLGGQTRLVCTECENPTAWLRHDQAILFTDGAAGRIQKVTLSDRKISTVLARDGLSLGDATWSPETEYLLFIVGGQQGRQIFAIKLPAADGAAKGEWIPITSESEWCDNPQWSTDGNTIYFLSNRDTFVCLWGQKFDARNRRTVGPAYPVAHFHDPHANPGLLVRSDVGLSVSVDSIILNSGEASETIWRGVLKPPRFSIF